MEQEMNHEERSEIGAKRRRVMSDVTSGIKAKDEERPVTKEDVDRLHKNFQNALKEYSTALLKFIESL